jgi:NUMOD3 motif
MHSEETRRKISESLMGHDVSEEARQKMSAARRGKSLSEEHRRKIGERSTIDERTSHPESSCWYSILHRCLNPNSRAYRNYGGRGITVYDEWLDPWTFFNYLDNELGPRPAGLWLDRIDNDGNYEPGNLRWANPLEQRRNQRERERDEYGRFKTSR